MIPEFKLQTALVKYIKRHKIGIMLVGLIFIIFLNHLLFLAQIDYVVYDHDQRHTAKPALKGYYQLKDGKIGDFVKSMFSHHEGYPGYPAFIGYLMALASYFFGLNEVVMRFVTLIFYIILIFYTYKCAKELDSQVTGVLSILIMLTMPAVVFWSRMIFPDFFGVAFLMGAFYYMLKSKYFLGLYSSILFGLFTGLCLLTHRVMFIPLFVLWVTAIGIGLKKERIANRLKGIILSLLTGFIVSGNFLFTYFKTYDSYHDLNQYNFFSKINYFRLFGRSGFFGLLKESLGQFGYDNLLITILLALCIIFGRRKKTAEDKMILFQYVTIASFCLFLGIWFVVTYFSEIRLINVRHFQILAPMLAIIIAVYLNKNYFPIRNIVIFIKGILILSLLLMITPAFGDSAILSPFRAYYRIPNQDGYGNGVIWSNRTFARRQELDYFKNEILRGDIAVMNFPVWNHLVSLADRLQLNGIGRSISFENTNPTANYIMFYCVSSDSLNDYLSNRQQYMDSGEDPNRIINLLKIEKFINENIADEIGVNEKVAIINTYGEFIYANIIENYIANFNFKKAKCFKYRAGNSKTYKVIFKCTENPLALKNSPDYKENWCFLRKL